MALSVGQPHSEQHHILRHDWQPNMSGVELWGLGCLMVFFGVQRGKGKGAIYSSSVCIST